MTAKNIRQILRTAERAHDNVKTSLPAAFTLRSPWTWETKPTMDVGFLYFDRVGNDGQRLDAFFCCQIHHDDDGFSSGWYWQKSFQQSFSVLTELNFDVALAGKTPWPLARERDQDTGGFGGGKGGFGGGGGEGEDASGCVTPDEWDPCWQWGGAITKAITRAGTPFWLR